MALREPRIEVSGSNEGMGTDAQHHNSKRSSMLSNSTTLEVHSQPQPEDTVQDKPRRKSWLKKWQELTNPKAEFSEEWVKQRTGMTKSELAEWLKVPENKKKAEKLWPSASYWAAL